MESMVGLPRDGAVFKSALFSRMVRRKDKSNRKGGISTVE